MYKMLIKNGILISVLAVAYNKQETGRKERYNQQLRESKCNMYEDLFNKIK